MLLALLSPLVIIPILSYVFKPQNFDWELLKNIRRADESVELAELEREEEANIVNDIESVPTYDSSDNKDSNESVNEKEKLKVVESKIKPITTILSNIQKHPASKLNEELEIEKENLARSLKWAYFLCIFFAFAFLLVWPMPMYGSHYIFSKKFFTGWVVVQIIWLFIRAFCVILLPLWEGRHGMYTTCRGMYWDLTGRLIN